MKKLIVFFLCIAIGLLGSPVFAGENWYENVQISGLIEAEAAYETIDYDDDAVDDETSSDIDLACVELGVDAAVAKNVEGHVLFLWEEDELNVDEGFITLSGGEDLPASLTVGRQYLPFGSYESFFITDPMTLDLGETAEGSAVAAYAIGEDMAEVSVGVFNGKAQKEDDDDTIDSFVAAVVVQPFEGLAVGASYTSNIASADGLNEEVQDPEALDAIVGGYSVFVTFTIMERFTLIGEYLSAAAEFEEGELYDAADDKRQPSAWNAELGIALNEDWEVAVRFAGSEDGGEFLPESQYGAVAAWGLAENTTLAFEYMHGTFEEDVMDVDAVTVNLGIEF